MKIRTNFVSNSSSSSFVCQICGSEYSGWDASLSDAGMFECKRGHVFCEDHIDESDLNKYRETRIKEIMKENECSYDEAENELDEYEYRYEFPSECCPICQLKEIIVDDALVYALYKLGFTRNILEDNIRIEFKTSEELNKVCNS